MYSDKKIDEYIEFVKNGDYVEDFKCLQDLALKNDVTYDGKIVPFTYQPLLVSKRDNDAFKFIVTRTNEIIRKITEKYLHDEKFRALFGFSKELEELILHDPLYEVPVAIGRYDVFFNSLSDFKFCEINTDGSSAMSEDSGLAEIFEESKIFKDLNWNLKSFELYDSWAQKSLDIYDMVRGSHQGITVAIVDFKGSGTPKDFVKFKEAYEKAGLKAIIADMEDLVYDANENALTFDGQKIDMVYRRAVTSEIMEKYDQSKAFIDAYLNDAFISIGSFRSQIAHNKTFFEVLHREDVKDDMDIEDVMFIEEHIPFTAKFEGDEDFFEEIVRDRAKYIFKPNDLRGARGVFVGSEYSEDEFREKAKEVYNKDFIYQEYVEKKFVKFIELDENDDWQVVERANMLGLFSYNEAFKGIYGRFGIDNIIGSAREYIAAPAFKYE